MRCSCGFFSPVRFLSWKGKTQTTTTKGYLFVCFSVHVTFAVLHTIGSLCQHYLAFLLKFKFNVAKRPYRP